MKNFKFMPILAATILLVTGCKTGNNASIAMENDGDKNPVEIVVVTSYGGDDGNRQNFEKAVMEYESASGNIVRDNSAVSNEEWKASVIKSFDDGTEPDVLFFFSGADANKLIETDKVVSLEEIRSVYSDYASNMNDDFVPVSPYDGKTYVVPVNGYWEGLFVNKKVLNECGVDVPNSDTTWEEFLADCQIIADKGYVPIAASLKEVPHYWFEYCVFNNGSVEKHLSVPESSDDDAGKTWIAGLEDIKQLYEAGFFPDNTTTVTSAVTDALMTSDKAAFMIDGSWKMGWFAENASNINDFTVTYVPGKGERKTTDIIGGISMGYYITRKAWEDPEKQAACVDFIESMTRDEVVMTFGATAVTALKNSVELSSDSSNLTKDAYQMTRHFTDIAGATGDNLTPDSRGSLFGNISGIATGKITAKEAIDLCLAIEN